MDPAGELPAPHDLRAADVDRQRVTARLTAAQAEGRLDIHEFDERLAAVWAARTYGDLAVLTRDLPPEPAPVADQGSGRDVRPAAASGKPRAKARKQEESLRQHASVWLGVSALNLVIWAVLSMSLWEFIYPWWVWVAGPWGAVLVFEWLTSKGGRR